MLLTLFEELLLFELSLRLGRVDCLVLCHDLRPVLLGKCYRGGEQLLLASYIKDAWTTNLPRPLSSFHCLDITACQSTKNDVHAMFIPRQVKRKVHPSSLKNKGLTKDESEPGFNGARPFKRQRLHTGKKVKVNESIEFRKPSTYDEEIICDLELVFSDYSFAHDESAQWLQARARTIKGKDGCAFSIPFHQSVSHVSTCSSTNIITLVFSLSSFRARSFFVSPQYAVL